MAPHGHRASFDDPEPGLKNRLAERIAGGETQALAEAYDEHCGPVLSLIQRVVDDPELAHSVLEETFLLLWRDARSIGRSPLLPWLLKAAGNVAMSRLRETPLTPRHPETEGANALQCRLFDSIYMHGFAARHTAHLLSRTTGRENWTEIHLRNKEISAAGTDGIH